MKLKIFGSAIATALALVACSPMEPQRDGGSVAPLNCTPNNCKVAVTVAGDCSNAANITLTPDRLPVPRVHHNIKIEWVIQTSGFKWVPAPGGITFTTPPIPPSGEFTNAHDNGTRYDLTDQNSVTSETEYKYGVHLQRANGTPCAVKDPTIVNGADK